MVSQEAWKLHYFFLEVIIADTKPNKLLVLLLLHTLLDVSNTITNLSWGGRMKGYLNRTCEKPTAAQGGWWCSLGGLCEGKCLSPVKGRTWQRGRQGQGLVLLRGRVARNRARGSSILEPSLWDTRGPHNKALQPKYGT